MGEQGIHSGAFRWITCNLEDNNDDSRRDIYKLLRGNFHIDKEKSLTLSFSTESLRWALGYSKMWNLALVDTKSEEMVAFAAGNRARTRIYDEVFSVSFFCVDGKCVSSEIVEIFTGKILKKIQEMRISRAVVAARAPVPLLGSPILSSSFWNRPLNVDRIYEVGIFQPCGMAHKKAMKFYKLSDKTSTPGLRRMQERDVSGVTEVLKKFLGGFVIAPDFNEVEVRHWFTPRDGIVESFVVEDPKGVISGFSSFYSVTVIREEDEAKSLNVACSLYNVSVSTETLPLKKLMMDMLILAKHLGHDVFSSQDVMFHNSFLKRLRFRQATGQEMFYHLCDSSGKGGTELKASDVALAVF